MVKVARIVRSQLVRAKLITHDALVTAVDHSFHALNIDGCQSTNDAVILLASGTSGVTPDMDDFGALLGGVCRDLARAMAEDAEGATRVVTLNLAGAASDDAASRTHV